MCKGGALTDLFGVDSPMTSKKGHITTFQSGPAREFEKVVLSRNLGQPEKRDGPRNCHTSSISHKYSKHSDDTHTTNLQTGHHVNATAIVPRTALKGRTRTHFRNPSVHCQKISAPKWAPTAPAMSENVGPVLTFPETFVRRKTEKNTSKKLMSATQNRWFLPPRTSHHTKRRTSPQRKGQNHVLA